MSLNLIRVGCGRSRPGIGSNTQRKAFQHTIRPQQYEMVLYQVGDYDFLIHPIDPQCEDLPSDLAYGDRMGFGIAWPVEDEDTAWPKLVAIIDNQHLQLVDYDELPPVVQQFVQEQYKRDTPRVKLRNTEDPPDDPR